MIRSSGSIPLPILTLLRPPSLCDMCIGQFPCQCHFKIQCFMFSVHWFKPQQFNFQFCRGPGYIVWIMYDKSWSLKKNKSKLNLFVLELLSRKERNVLCGLCVCAFVCVFMLRVFIRHTFFANRCVAESHLKVRCKLRPKRMIASSSSSTSAVSTMMMPLMMIIRMEKAER